MSGREAVARRAFENARELAELDRKLRCADDPHLAICNLEIVLSRLQHVARELFRFLRHRARGKQHG